MNKGVSEERLKSESNVMKTSVVILMKVMKLDCPEYEFSVMVEEEKFEMEVWKRF